MRAATSADTSAASAASAAASARGTSRKVKVLPSRLGSASRRNSRGKAAIASGDSRATACSASAAIAPVRPPSAS